MWDSKQFKKQKEQKVSFVGFLFAKKKRKKRIYLLSIQIVSLFFMFPEVSDNIQEIYTYLRLSLGIECFFLA